MRVSGSVLVCFLVVATLALAGESSACPSCYGAADSPQTQGMNWAILSLLAVTGSVLVAISGFFLYLRKKALEFNRLFSNRLN